MATTEREQNRIVRDGGREGERERKRARVKMNKWGTCKEKKREREEHRGR